MKNPNFSTIFRKGSTTYYYSSLFFPPTIREDVFTLYAFVRTADNYVDAVPQQSDKFHAFEQETYQALDGNKSHNDVIDAFVHLAKRKHIEKTWIVSFLDAMKQDLKKTTYQTFEELEAYMYGSAEVVGLMMARIFELPEQSLRFAQLQGKAMQLINFVRDIKEDIELGRTYLPVEDMKRFGIQSLPPKSPQEVEVFAQFMLFEIQRYEEIQQEAENGYPFIPRSFRIPVKTAAQMYLWTANQIKKNPMIVFEKKIKPKPAYVMLNYGKNLITG
jgi:phytoene synthase